MNAVDDEKLQDRAPERQERPKETSGEYLLRVLKPAGCILVLILFIAYLVFCFTYRSDLADLPVPTAQAEQRTQD